MANKRGKKYKEMKKNFEDKEYSLKEAIEKAKETSYSSFPGSISLHFAMKLPKEKDPKSVKGTLSLPNQVKQEDKRIIVFCESDYEDKAKDAGAVEAGLDDLVKKIEEGWSDFDIAIATPSVMGQIAVLGRYLGPQGLMPTPKTGTLVEANQLEAAIEEFQKGKSQFITDDTGVVHMLIGNVEMDTEKIAENALTAIDRVSETVTKPTHLLAKSITVSATMGAGVKVSKDFLEEE
jgi:large subunit ribosomal protein L1